MTAAGQKRQHCGCVETVSLFFSISAEGMAPSGMQLRTEKRYGGL